MIHRFDFVAIGDNCIDRFQDGDKSELVGGNAVNVAAQLSMLGRNVAYFGAVGDDRDGELTVKILNKVGVNTDYVKVVPGLTAYSLIKHDEAGDRDIYFEEFGVTANYLPDEKDLDIIGLTKHAHIGWLNDGGKIPRQLANNNVTVSRDLSINLNPECLDPDGLNIAILSASNLDDAKEKAEGLLQVGAKMALVTAGEHGSLVADGADIAFIKAELIEPVDTTGAGDAFIAGFLNAYYDGSSLEASLKAGRTIATKACLHMGGFAQ
ncbi:MAG: PfkB family carbohydrate kinase [Granulosicoccus sp.]